MSVFISVKETAKLYEWWSRSLHVCGVTLVVFIPKVKTGSVFPTFCHATFHHALITCCNVSRAHDQMYHDLDTFDFSKAM